MNTLKRLHERVMKPNGLDSEYPSLGLFSFVPALMAVIGSVYFVFDGYPVMRYAFLLFLFMLNGALIMIVDRYYGSMGQTFQERIETVEQRLDEVEQQ